MSVLQAAYNELALTNSRLRAENDRLRAALKQIVDGRNHDSLSRNIAKVALGERGIGAMFNQEE